MKINIIFSFQDGPYGGGNQFLKALRNELKLKNLYTEKKNDADIFLFNSFQDLKEAIITKIKYPNALFVHRIDGPISLYRNTRNKYVDLLIHKLNECIADATIFQSHYSLKENKKIGIKENELEAIIYNASDNKIFKPKSIKHAAIHKPKIKLVSTSWSSNMMKGFDVYKYLDETLNFSKYEYTFVGNTPINFKNINHIPPVESKGLAKILEDSDIYITASKRESCSNSLIEAMSCKIPAICINDGSHPELIKEGGEIFSEKEEIVHLIEKISKNYESYVSAIPNISIETIANEYIEEFEKINSKKNNGYNPKKLNFVCLISAFYYYIASRLFTK